jgi:hypothetical protein
VLAAPGNPPLLVVQNPDGQKASAVESFFWEPAAPVIDSVEPGRLSTAGGTLVHIRGAGFADVAGKPIVTFGGTPATGVGVLSDVEIVATAPAAAMGTVDLVVANPRRFDDPVSSEPFSVQYREPVAAPAVSGLDPVSGPVGGGTTVTITGSAFSDPEVAFGAQVASVVTWTATEIVVTTPGVTDPGPVVVTVYNEDGQAAAQTQSFSYVDANTPTALGASPAEVHADVPGDVVTLLGANLQPSRVTAVALDDGSTAHAATLLPGGTDLQARLRVDAALPAAAQLTPTLTYDDASVLTFPPVLASPPAPLFANVIGGVAEEGSAFTLALQGASLFPAQLDKVLLDPDNSQPVVELDPLIALETLVQVAVPAGAVVQGDWLVGLRYSNGHRVDAPLPVYVAGDCGNGTVEAGEECDGNNLDGMACTDVAGGFVGGTLRCSPTCTFETSLCDACGNDALDTGEECDGDDFGGLTCADLSAYDDGDLGCLTGCVLDTSSCTRCGDGEIEGFEQCEGSGDPGVLCSALGLGYTDGDVACDAQSCRFDTAACFTCGDGFCSDLEDNTSCAADCLPSCGDGMCNNGELCSDCAKDCGVCGPYFATVTAGDGAQVDMLGMTQLSVRVANGSDEPVEGVTVTLDGPVGGGAAAVTTDSDGEATLDVAVGRVLGARTARVGFSVIGGATITPAEIDVSFDVQDVAQGTMLTLMNRSRDAGGSTLAGGAALQTLSEPSSIVVDANDNVYVADRLNNVIWRVLADDTLEVVAGTPGAPGAYAGDGGTAGNARLFGPSDLELDAGGDLWIADRNNGAIRVIRAGGDGVVTASDTIELYAGRGGDNSWEGKDRLAVNLAATTRIALTPDGDVFFLSLNANPAIWRIDPAGAVTRWVAQGTCAPLRARYLDDALDYDSTGRLFWSGAVAPLSGCPVGSTDVIGATPTDDTAAGIAFLNGHSGTSVELPNGDWLVALTSSNRIYEWDRLRNGVRLVNYDGIAGDSGDGGAAADARIDAPLDVAVDSTGNVYVADTGNRAVRMVRGPLPGRGQYSFETLTGDQQTTHPGRPAAIGFEAQLKRDDVEVSGRNVLMEPVHAWARLEAGADTDPDWRVVAGTTDSLGRTPLAVAWAPWELGPQVYRATVLDHFGDLVPYIAPTEVTVTITVPPDGTLLAFVNTDTNRITTLPGTVPPAMFKLKVNSNGGGLVFHDGQVITTAGVVNNEYQWQPVSMLVGFDLSTGASTRIAGYGPGDQGAGGTLLDGRMYDTIGAALDGDVMYVGDFTNQKVRVLDLAGDAFDTLAGGGTLDVAASEGLDARLAALTNPKDVAVGPDGTVYFTDGDCSLRVVTTDGTITRLIDSCGYCGSAAGPMDRLDGVTVTASGDLYVSGFVANAGGCPVGGTAYYIARVDGLNVLSDFRRLDGRARTLNASGDEILIPTETDTIQSYTPGGSLVRLVGVVNEAQWAHESTGGANRVAQPMAAQRDPATGDLYILEQGWSTPPGIRVLYDRD